jgi:hypothetical protein
MASKKNEKDENDQNVMFSIFVVYLTGLVEANVICVLYCRLLGSKQKKKNFEVM